MTSQPSMSRFISLGCCFSRTLKFHSTPSVLDFISSFHFLIFIFNEHFSYYCAISWGKSSPLLWRNSLKKVNSTQQHSVDMTMIITRVILIKSLPYAMLCDRSVELGITLCSWDPGVKVHFLLDSWFFPRSEATSPYTHKGSGKN